MLARDAHHYDNHTRTGPKIFVGEWASQEGRPTPDLEAAIGDAAWLTGLERNSDLVIMEAYAPMLVNINPGASQWPTNLIGYDALNSYGSPSYWVQRMFSTNHGDVVLPATLTQTGGSQISESVTRDSKSGTIFAKVVNATGSVQPIHITVNGISGIQPNGKTVVLASGSPQDTNTLTNPQNVVPSTRPAQGMSNDFNFNFAPNSVTVLQIGVHS
jgi:alpha-L-arabinofuranosidase